MALYPFWSFRDTMSYIWGEFRGETGYASGIQQREYVGVLQK